MLKTFKSVLLILTVAFVIGAPSHAADEYNVSTGVTTAGVPLGVHGVDSVALVTLGAVARGDATRQRFAWFVSTSCAPRWTGSR